MDPFTLDGQKPHTIQNLLDGKWVTYQSKRTGVNQIYLRRFPVTDEEWQVSIDGGSAATFSEEEAAIFFLAGEQRFGEQTMVMRVSFATEPEVALGTPEKLFDLSDDIRLNATSFADGKFIGCRLELEGNRRIVIDTRGVAGQ